MPPDDKRDLQRLLPSLNEVRRKEGFLSSEAMGDLASSLSVPLGDIFGTATFYSFFPTEPAGKHVIRICKSVPCHLQDADMIIDAVQKELGIIPGETSADNLFSFEVTNCIGACDQSPAMMVDDDVYGSLTPAMIETILKSFETKGGKDGASDA